MMNFMRDGGFGMWATLLAAIGTFVVGHIRPRESRSRIFTFGAIVSLASGLLGMATGLMAVAAHYNHFPQPLEALAMGLRELSNNGVFGAALAVIQLVFAAIYAPRPGATAAA